MKTMEPSCQPKTSSAKMKSGSTVIEEIEVRAAFPRSRDFNNHEEVLTRQIETGLRPESLLLDEATSFILMSTNVRESFTASTSYIFSVYKTNLAPNAMIKD